MTAIVAGCCTGKLIDRQSCQISSPRQQLEIRCMQTLISHAITVHIANRGTDSPACVPVGLPIAVLQRNGRSHRCPPGVTPPLRNDACCSLRVAAAVAGHRVSRPRTVSAVPGRCTVVTDSVEWWHWRWWRWRWRRAQAGDDAARNCAGAGIGSAPVGNNAALHCDWGIPGLCVQRGEAVARVS